jgi:simple sugar transport system substrate-binding protein
VGGDEYLTGTKLGEYVIEQVNAGKIPKPTKIMCANHDATHSDAIRSQEIAGRIQRRPRKRKHGVRFDEQYVWD